MLSKTSFFNKTLFKKNMARFWPLWGLVSFIGLLLPATMLLNLSQNPVEPYELTYLYYNALAYVIPAVSLVYAIVCAAATWEYLFFPRNLSLMHTLPIKREGIFATNFLSGMAMMLIPYVVTGGMCIVVSLIFGCFDFLPLLETIAGVLGLNLFYFCSATFVAFLTGNIFMLPALYFLLHFLAPLLDFLTSTYASQFIYGFSGDYSGAADFLSPTVYLMRKLDIATIRETIPDPSFPSNMMTTVVDYEFQGLWLIGIYALVGLVLLALAWWLYSRRRSECAGDVIAVRHLKPVFRFGIAALAALTGGLLLYAMLWSPIRSSVLINPVPLAVFMVIAGAIGYYAASMMLAKSLRVFRGSWKGLALVVLCSAALCFGLSNDVLGIGARVPAANTIQTLTFQAADNTYTFDAEDFESNDTEAALLAQVLDLHAAIAADRSYIVDFLDEWNRSIPLDDDGNFDYSDLSTHNPVRFTYTLKDGTSMTRRYSVHLTRDRLNQPDTYDAKLNALINNMDMRCKRLLTDRPEYEPYNGEVWLDFGIYNNFSLNDRETATLLEAVRKDAANGTWGTYYWFDSDRESRYAMSIDLRMRHYYENGNYDSTYLNIQVNPGMEHTIDALIELGIVESKESMVTYSQINFQEFCDLLEQKYDVFPHELSHAELQRYCDEFGYDYNMILKQLYGEDAFATTSFPTTSSSSTTRTEDVITGTEAAIVASRY